MPSFRLDGNFNLDDLVSEHSSAQEALFPGSHNFDDSRLKALIPLGSGPAFCILSLALEALEGYEIRHAAR